MVRNEVMDQSVIDRTISGVIVAIVSGVFGWLIATLSIRKRFEDFETRVVDPLKERLSKFELTTVTREEHSRSITDVKDLIKDVKDTVNRIDDKMTRRG